MSRIIDIGGGRSADVTDTASVRRRYAGIGYTSEAAVVSAFATYVTDNSLDAIGGMLLDRVTPTEMEVESNWWIDAEWTPFRRRAPVQAGETVFSAPEFNFEFALSPEKIYVPIGSQTLYQRTGVTDTPPTVALIGDQGDGKPPEGVDLLVPEISFSETRYIRQSALDETAKNNLLRLIGRVNTTAFRSWDAGEVLCAGIGGRARGRDDVEVNVRYRVKQNKTISVPGFDDFDVLGWEYVWPRHRLKFDGTAVKTTSEIQMLIVAQVFETTSFAILE